MWTDFIPLLSQHLSDTKFVCPDLPGFGESSFNERLNSLEDVAEELSHFLKKYPKISLIGHSMGGYLMMELLKSKDLNIESLCFFNSSIFSDTKDKKEGRNKIIKFLEKNGHEVFVKSFFPGLFANPENHSALIGKLINLAIKSNTSKNLIRYMKLMRDRKDQSELLINSKISVHFIIGEKDASIPLNTSQKQIEIIKRSSQLILQNYAHMGMFESPKQCAESIINFIKERRT